MEYTSWEKLPSDIEKKLSSVKNFFVGYEYEQDYKKLLKSLENTNPFSVLIFYDYPKEKLSKKNVMKRNLGVPRSLLFGSNFNQVFYVPELKRGFLGNSHGSDHRWTQSMYALALSLFSKNVPTDILVYNNHVIKHVMSSSSLIVHPHEVSGGAERLTIDAILNDTKKAYAQWNNGSIESIDVKY